LIIVTGGCALAVPGTYQPGFPGGALPLTGRTLASSNVEASRDDPSIDASPNSSVPKSNSGAGLTFTTLCYGIAAAVAASLL
jgi:hypothetical protein